jgi:hypothetical protein
MTWQFIPRIPTKYAFENRFFKESPPNLKRLLELLKSRKYAFEGQIFLQGAAEKRRIEQMISTTENEVAELQARIDTEREVLSKHTVELWQRKIAEAPQRILAIRENRIRHEVPFRGLWEFNDIMTNLEWNEDSVKMIHLFRLGEFQKY